MPTPVFIGPVRRSTKHKETSLPDVRVSKEAVDQGWHYTLTWPTISTSLVIRFIHRATRRGQVFVTGFNEATRELETWSWRKT